MTTLDGCSAGRGRAPRRGARPAAFPAGSRRFHLPLGPRRSHASRGPVWRPGRRGEDVDPGAGKAVITSCSGNPLAQGRLRLGARPAWRCTRGWIPCPIKPWPAFGLRLWKHRGGSPLQRK
ncbi:hypothetical protein NDU88_011298 [Pleurodeles waltl]|uniref:Uncharacterized protein n=1 Tax=Pleurodeles waltl TaxID=8319 RepID=A0AAV7PXT5_PLEWA|nr:hypothetical protein NDU88_011298 [Pleurodeles waltl]